MSSQFSAVLFGVLVTILAGLLLVLVLDWRTGRVQARAAQEGGWLE